MDYLQQLQANRQQAGLEPNPWLAEWQLLRSTKYVYNPTYDYLSEIRDRYIREYDYPKGNGILVFNAVFFEKYDSPRPDKHLTAYNFWLNYKYQDFRINWKPKDNDGLNFLFITFNFSPKITINDVKLEIDRIINLPIFNDCKLTYCFENYTESGEHPHVHMLVELKRTGSLSFSTIKQKIFQKKSLSEIMNINIKMSWAKDYNDRTQKRAVHLAYLSGNKIEKKQEDCEKDKLWRSVNNLNDLYIRA